MSNNFNNYLFLANKKLTAIPPKDDVVCKADTGASSNYVTERDQHSLEKLEKIMYGPTVRLPDNSQIQANKRGLLPLPKTLSITARTAHVFKGLTNASLISIGKLCDDGCVAVFDKLDLRIFKKNKLVLFGKRNFTDGLWDINISDHFKPALQSMNMIVRKDSTKTNLAEYLHKCAFSPSIPTFLKAIRNGYFQSWPGIDSINFKKFLRNLIPTAKGHLDQERKNLQSTKILPDDTDDFFPQPEQQKTYEYACQIVPAKPKETTYADLTGRFPYASSRGNEYIFIMYDFDSNLIQGEPIKNCQA